MSIYTVYKLLNGVLHKRGHIVVMQYSTYVCTYKIVIMLGPKEQLRIIQHTSVNYAQLSTAKCETFSPLRIELLA